MLQTDNTHKPTNLLLNNSPVHVNGLAAHASILAGLARSLGGIVPPTDRLHGDGRRSLSDYTWAVGMHPFGQLVAGTGGAPPSPHLAKIALRNSAVSRVYASRLLVREAKKKIEEFAEKRMIPVGGRGGGAEGQGAQYV